MKLTEQIDQATSFLQKELDGFQPEAALILGSGLGFLANEMRSPLRISYSDIPHFPLSTVAGHAGCFVFGEFEGKRVMFMQGRFHFYEGYSMQVLSVPVRVMKKLAVKNLVVTNAAGGVNPSFQPGDLMLIKDHINFAFSNPLIGENLGEFGPRFPDTQEAYNKDLQEVARKEAERNGIKLKEGIYLFMTGPSYETPAEIRMAKKLGADAVGMSTFPEVLTATHCGIKVVGISYISNLAAGISGQPLSHEEVMETVDLVKGKMSILIKGILRLV